MNRMLFAEDSLDGNPDECLRKFSWDLLCQLGRDQRLSWLVVGDFNEITFSFEKERGYIRLDKNITAFHLTLSDCAFNGLGFFERWYT